MANQLKISLPTTKKRSPLNILSHNMNQGAPSHIPTLINQWLVTTFRDQLLAIKSTWNSPKEEPLDLSFKKPRLKLASDNIFCSIRKLVELQPSDDPETQRRSTFPLSKPLEATFMLPHNVELLINSVLLFNDLKPNLLDIVNPTDLVEKELVSERLVDPVNLSYIGYLKTGIK